jgi:hypothetical protein
VRRLFRYPPLVIRIAKQTGTRSHSVAVVTEMLMDDAKRQAAWALGVSPEAYLANLVTTAATRVRLPEEKVREVAKALLVAGKAVFDANQPGVGSAK